MVLLAALRGQCKFQTLASSSLNTNFLSDDPSVPPANGAERLTALPNEVQHLISTHSDLMARHSIGLSCTALRQNTDAPPPMSRGDYIEFQKQLEIHSSRKLRHLYCPSCDTFKKPTPSKTTFTDAQAVQNHSGRRFCIECGIANGHFDRRDVVIKKKKLFLCGGCKLLLPHEKEESVIADAVFTKAYPYRDSGWGQGAEITIDSGRKRWCRSCRAVIANLGESGAVKVRQVYIR